MPITHSRIINIACMKRYIEHDLVVKNSPMLRHRIAAFVGVYLVVGVMYNRFVNGARGVEQLPNYSFWGSLCSNIAVRSLF